MAVHIASASGSARADGALSADNARPDRFRLIEILRLAAPALALGPSVVATVDALLSCLPPKRTHDVVHASNETLTARCHGITDRTLRRHIAELVSIGLLRRIDSPNGKRYAKRSTLEGMAMRFGLDLSPLFASFGRLCDLAKARQDEDNQCSWLRARLRIALQRSETASESHPEAQALLRRKVDSRVLQGWLDRLAPLDDITGPNDMSASNSQNVRHQQNSEKELKNDTAAEDIADPRMIEGICEEAASFLVTPIRTPDDILIHAERMAPMIGIDRQTFDLARQSKGGFGAALTVWIVLELAARLQRPAAYFRAITSGRRSADFCPVAALHRLGQRKGLIPSVVRGQSPRPT